MAGPRWPHSCRATRARPGQLLSARPPPGTFLRSGEQERQSLWRPRLRSHTTSLLPFVGQGKCQDEPQSGVGEKTPSLDGRSGQVPLQEGPGGREGSHSTSNVSHTFSRVHARARALAPPAALPHISEAPPLVSLSTPLVHSRLASIRQQDLWAPPSQRTKNVPTSRDPHCRRPGAGSQSPHQGGAGCPSQCQRPRLRGAGC